MSDTVKIKVTATASSNVSYRFEEEVDTGCSEEEWAEMNEDAREKLASEIALETLLQDIGWSWDVTS